MTAKYVKTDRGYYVISPLGNFTIHVLQPSKNYFFCISCTASIPSTEKSIKLHPAFRCVWHSLRQMKEAMEELVTDAIHEENVRKDALQKYGPKGLRSFYEINKLFKEF